MSRLPVVAPPRTNQFRVWCVTVDPLGSLLFALVLQKLVSSVDADAECMDNLYQAWYLDDGALAGNRPAVLQTMHII